MPLVLPKRCPNCGRKCVKNANDYWLCAPVTGGCGWTDDPGIIQPLGERTVSAEIALPAET